MNLKPLINAEVINDRGYRISAYPQAMYLTKYSRRHRGDNTSGRAAEVYCCCANAQYNQNCCPNLSHRSLPIYLTDLDDRVILPAACREPYIRLAGPYYGGSAPRTHHEIEWFFATTIDQGLDTTKVVIGNYPMKRQRISDCQSGVDEWILRASGFGRARVTRDDDFAASEQAGIERKRSRPEQNKGSRNDNYKEE